MNYEALRLQAKKTAPQIKIAGGIVMASLNTKSITILECDRDSGVLLNQDRHLISPNGDGPGLPRPCRPTVFGILKEVMDHMVEGLVPWVRDVTTPPAKAGGFYRLPQQRLLRKRMMQSSTLTPEGPVRAMRFSPSCRRASAQHSAGGTSFMPDP